MHRGFTLLELVIVLAIITLLARLGIGNYASSIEKGRDAKRKSDLAAMQKAFEMYYNDAGQYPPTSVNVVGNPLSYSGNTYIVKIPGDPKGNAAYTYCLNTTTNRTYALYARLENKNDTQIVASPNSSGTCTSAPPCVSPDNRCYGVSSSDIKP